MRRLALALLIGCGGAQQAPRAPVARAHVVATYPHATDAFTQGLELHDGWLYESTGLAGYSSLRVVDLATGEIESRVAVPEALYAEGITIVNDRVYQLTYQTQRGFVYDAETLEVVGERIYEGEGWGLTHVGGELVMSDGTSRLRVLDPETFRVTRVLDVRDGDTPVDQLNELEMVEGELYANVWMSDRIARIDLASGRVLGWIDLAFLRAGLGLTERQAVLNGIAYDEAQRRLFVTGKLWPLLYEIRVE